MPRVYAAATGQCIHRDSSDSDDTEQARAVENFRDDIRLDIDLRRGYVVGLVTVVRTTEEPFLFAVDTDHSNPIVEFYSSVRRLVNQKPDWDLYPGRPESAAVDALLEHSGESRKTEEVDMIENHGEDTPTESIHQNYMSAVLAIDRYFQTSELEDLPPDRIVVARNPIDSQLLSIDHVCRIDQTDSKTSESPPSSPSSVWLESLRRWIFDTT